MEVEGRREGRSKERVRREEAKEIAFTAQQSSGSAAKLIDVKRLHGILKFFRHNVAAVLVPSLPPSLLRCLAGQEISD
eukprot:754578-Hanusia_phi.AAC.3